MVANCYRSLSRGHQTHTDILDNIAGRKGKISHLLGVDLLGLRHDRDVSVVDGGVKQSEETECKSGTDLGVLILGTWV